MNRISPEASSLSSECRKEQGWSEEEMVTNRPITKEVINPGYTQHQLVDIVLGHGSVVIAAITSCTNTSQPQRDARSRAAGEKSGREGAYGQLQSQDKPGARFARRHRLSA